MRDFAPSDHPRTFLRSHIHEVLRRGYAPGGPAGWEGLVAFTDLEGAAVCDDLTLERFLYGVPGRLAPLYQPTQVAILGNAHALAPTGCAHADDLSALLGQLRRGDPGGVLLQAPSGFGKTAALWRAFFDCVSPRSGLPLGGYLPLMLRVTAYGLPSDPTWEQLLGHVVPTCPAGLLQRWFRDGPPLLLLCDFDEIPAGSQPGALRALVAFQSLSRMEGRRHRCVIATKGCDPDLLPYSEGPDRFFRYALGEWSEEQARTYADALATWRPAEPERPPLTGGVFRDMFPRTPYLVHALAFAPPPVEPRRTNARLYAYALDRQLDRWHDSRRLRPPALPPGIDLRSAIRAGAVRVAMYHQLGGGDDRAAVGRILGTPVPEVHTTVLSHLNGDADWWRRQHTSHYYTNPTDPTNPSIPCAAFREFLLTHSPFFRHSENRVRFLSDAVRHFFAASGVRYFREPESPPTLDGFPDWPRMCLRRLATRSEGWRAVAPLLGGMLGEAEIRDLIRVYACEGDAMLEPEFANVVPEILIGIIEGSRDLTDGLFERTGRLLVAIQGFTGYPEADRTGANFSDYLHCNHPDLVDWLNC